MLEHYLRFDVPAGAARDLRQALESVSEVGQCDEVVLAARYFDTPDARLAAARTSVRLRREAGQWIQTWQTRRGDGVGHIEHHVPVAHGALNLATFAGRPGTAHLMRTEAKAKQLQAALVPRFQFVFERTRCVGAYGTTPDDCVVALTLDAGEFRARSRQQPVLELGIRLLNGSLAMMLRVATSWQDRFGLIWQPESIAVAGQRFAARKPLPATGRKPRVILARNDRVGDAAGIVVDQCIEQIAVNGAGMCSKQSKARHFQQCHASLRRLSVALKLFKGWVEPPPVAVQQALHQLLDGFGTERHQRLIREKFLGQLYAAGCGPLGFPLNAAVATRAAGSNGVNDSTLSLAGDVQRLLMGLLVWRHESLSSNSANRQFHPLLLGRLNKQIRKIRKLATRFDQLTHGELEQMRQRIRDLSIAVDFSRTLLPKKDRKTLKRVVFVCQPLLRTWRDLQHAADMLDTGGIGTVADDLHRGSRQFAAGWLAGRTLGLRFGLSVLMKRIARVRLQL
ncbi:MAG: CHAD domain-containing protein [Burkholderiaceae bacterium]